MPAQHRGSLKGWFYKSPTKKIRTVVPTWRMRECVMHSVPVICNKSSIKAIIAAILVIHVNGCLWLRDLLWRNGTCVGKKSFMLWAEQTCLVCSAPHSLFSSDSLKKMWGWWWWQWWWPCWWCMWPWRGLLQCLRPSHPQADSTIQWSSALSCTRT